MQSRFPSAAVHGNIDTSEVTSVLPKRRIVKADGVLIGMVHDAGPSRGRLDRMRLAFPGADAVVFGHSHIPLHERGPDGFQIFNPGSPTDRRAQPRHTMGLARVENGSIDFELVFLVAGAGSQTLVVALFYNVFAGGVRPVYSVDAMAVMYMVTVMLVLLVALRFVRPTQMVFRLDQPRR